MRLVRLAAFLALLWTVLVILPSAMSAGDATVQANAKPPFPAIHRNGAITDTSPTVQADALPPVSVIDRAGAITGTGATVPFGAKPIPPPDNPITVPFTPGADLVLTSSDGKMELRLPGNAAAEPLRIDYSPLPLSVSTGMRIVKQFRLEAVAPGRGNAPVHTFAAPATLRLTYADEDVRGLDLTSFRFFWLDEKAPGITSTASRWVPLPTLHDAVQKTFTAQTDHFSIFGGLANPAYSLPATIMNFQTDLHSGTATTVYPFELPPGPGGFAPKLEMTYSSGVPDGMHNKRDTGSWVGIGWTLHLSRVFFNEESAKWYLELNQASYELVNCGSGSPWVRCTVPYSPLYVQRLGCPLNGGTEDCWRVRDTEGTLYEFGSTPATRLCTTTAASGCGSYIYRYDLYTTQDTHGNSLKVEYAKTYSDSGDAVRSAQPTYMYWGNTPGLEDWRYRVWFNNAGGRPDVPQGTSGNPEPLVVEKESLAQLAVYYCANPSPTCGGWQLVRRYDLAYQNTPSYYSTDYGGIYYAGTHKLVSITQIGSDGSSPLPATMFAYQDRQVYFYDTTSGSSPGNPAQLTWPFLTRVDNGYGGSVRFQYTQMPTPPVDNVWTRQVVTQRTVGPDLVANVAGTVSGGAQWTSGVYGSALSGTAGLMTIPDDPDLRLTGPLTVAFWVKRTGAGGIIAIKERSGGNGDYWIEEPVGGTIKCRSNGGEGLADTGMLMPVNEWRHIALTLAPNDLKCYVDGVLPVGATDTDTQGAGAFGTATPIYFGRNIPGLSFFPGAIDDVRIFDRVLSASEINTVKSGGTISSGLVGYWRLDESAGSIAAPSKFTDGVPIASAYAYTGNPEYYSSGVAFNAEYRGFRQVRETRGDGSSIEHFFFTTGSFNLTHPVDGAIPSRDGDLLKGHEYQTVWYSGGGGAEVQRRFSDWNYAVIVPPSGSGSATYVRLLNQGTVVGSKKVWTRYEYDNYNNVIREKFEGDTAATGDEVLTRRYFYPNGSAWIVDRIAQEEAYDGLSEVAGQLRAKRQFYYDAAPSVSTPPVKGDLTKEEAFKDAGSWVTTTHTYDASGNRISTTDANGNATSFTYACGGSYPSQVTYPPAPGGTFTQLQGWDCRLGRKTSDTDMNGQVTSYEYDPLGRPVKVVRPGDSTTYPSERYSYLSWGTPGQQRVKAETKVADTDYLWAEEYFDGLGRIVQVRQREVSPNDLIASTIHYDNTGRAWKSYVPWRVAGGGIGYVTPPAGTLATVTTYDALDRVLTRTGPDGGQEMHAYTPATDSLLVWKETLTNPMGHKKSYFSDARGQLDKVQELYDTGDPYASTTYTQDALGRLTRVQDTAGNATTMSYDWLSRKTAMTDPDMGAWSYTYDSTGNLLTQTDARGTTLGFSYDALGRMTEKGEYTAGGTDGTLSGGAQWTAGANSNALSFDGVNDYLTIPDHPTLRLAGSLTVTLWAKRTGAGGIFILKERDSGNGDYWISTGSGTIRCNSNGGVGAADSLVPMAQDQWYHIALTLAPNDLKCYLDGVLKATDADTQGADGFGTATPIFVGRDLPGASFFLGAIDDVRIFNRVLDSNEINTVKAGGTVTSGLVGHWKLDEGSGATAGDSSGNGNGGQITGAIWGPGVSGMQTVYGSSLSFDGTDDYVTIPDSPTLRLTGPLTVAFWVKWTGVGGTILIKESAGGSGDYWINNPGDGTIWCSSNGGHGLADTGVSMTVGQWHHIALTLAPDDLKCYVDGVLKVTGTYTQGADGIGTATPIYLGRSIGGAPFFPGSIDDVRIYNRVLDSNEINTVKAGGIVTSGLVGHWKLDEGSGATVGDSSGNGNSGQIAGAIWGAGVSGTQAVYGDALSFDGTDDYVSMPPLENLEVPDGDFTIMAWVNARDSARLQAIAGKLTFASNIDTWGLYVASGKACLQFSQPDQPGYSACSTTSIQNNAWYHVAAVRQGTTNYLYVNGVVENSVAVAQTVSTTGRNFYIGRRDQDNSYNFGGIVDDVRLYDRALSVSQINSAKAGGTVASGLVGHWKLDEGAGTTASNSAVAGSISPTLATYTYDDVTGGNMGKGRRTGMADASGSSAWRYDARGRLSQEQRAISDTTYTMAYGYDSGDRLATVTYPGGEMVTQTYNLRGLPEMLSSSVYGALVSWAGYNQLGLLTNLEYANGVSHNFDYYGIEWQPGFATSYGRLFMIRSQKGSTVLQSLTHYWDANGNLTSRSNYALVPAETETFAYDFLDRLTGVSGAYAESYAYNPIGNITSTIKSGAPYTYTYGAKPHAVTAVGATAYTYDTNGNMTARGTQTLTWNMENRLSGVSGGASFVYDGDGVRVKKTEGGQTTVYPNRYYEKNVTTGVATKH
ncbi:MAG: hypothetical protein HY681_05835 [Chloroflexi bacterium]|nr:hypothetical protein [Chloroflexota bacterium]